MFGAGPAVPGASGQMHRERAEVAREKGLIILPRWADDYPARIIIKQVELVTSASICPWSELREIGPFR